MRWALMMIRLAAACRNTSVNRTTGTAPEPMMSASTCPGPTEGNWSISPTINSAALSGVAFTSACISMTSTIEASSTTSRSQSRGLSALRLKPRLFGSTSKSRWIVLASTPVASVIRFAARPVGAQSNNRTPLAARILRIELTIVVLPTPGPPVITSAFAVSARRIAAFWLSASCRPLRFSTQGRALSSSIHGQGSPAVHDADQPIGDRLLGPVEACQEGAGGVADLVGDHGAVGSFELEGCQDQLLRRFEQVFGERDQLIRRQPAVTLVHRLGQGVRYPGAQSDPGRLFDAEPHRDRIGALETDASDRVST